MERVEQGNLVLFLERKKMRARQNLMNYCGLPITTGPPPGGCWSCAAKWSFSPSLPSNGESDHTRIRNTSVYQRAAFLQDLSWNPPIFQIRNLHHFKTEYFKID